MKGCKNFKVRINAAVALQTPQERADYGSVALFTSLWKYLIEAVEESRDVKELSNYKHANTLSKQVLLNFSGLSTTRL